MSLAIDHMHDVQQNSLAPPDSPGSYANHSTSWTPSEGLTPLSTNPSRKRSRDETAFMNGDETSYFSFPSAQSVEPPPPIPEEPIYGEGMVLLNPSTGLVISAESQTGTWYEEKQDQESLRREFEQDQAQAQRPRMPVSRKSIRMSQSSIRSQVTPQINGAPNTPPESQHNSDVDEASVALGIGWTKVGSADPDIQGAIRGWERYIDLHYTAHIHNATILLKHEGLDVYLVQAQEGYFLLKQDLKQGQFVSHDWNTCLASLQSTPPKLESTEILSANQTPAPDSQLPIDLLPQTTDGHNLSRQNYTSAVGMEIDA